MEENVPPSPPENFRQSRKNLSQRADGITARTIKDLRTAPVSPAQNRALRTIASILENPEGIGPATKEQACLDAIDILDKANQPWEHPYPCHPDNAPYNNWALSRRYTLREELRAEARKHSPANRSRNQDQYPMEQMTDEQGSTFQHSKRWETMSHRDQATLQLLQQRLWMPFKVFHNAVEKTLGRTVPATELGLNRSGLIEELLEGRTTPALHDILPGIANNNA